MQINKFFYCRIERWIHIWKKNKRNCGKLDADIYWKDCNFLENDEYLLDTTDMVYSYSRDKCHSMSFRELLLWYLPRLGSWQDEPCCDDCVHKDCDNFMHMDNCKDMVLDKEIKKKHYELFLELVDIYAYYTQQDHVKYRELKDKCKSM